MISNLSMNLSNFNYFLIRPSVLDFADFTILDAKSALEVIF